MQRLRPHAFAFVVLVVVFVGVVFWRPSNAAQRIQYKVVAIQANGPADAMKLEQTLNQLGAQGWDLTDHEGDLYMFTKQN